MTEFADVVDVNGNRHVCEAAYRHAAHINEQHGKEIAHVEQVPIVEELIANPKEIHRVRPSFR